MNFKIEHNRIKFYIILIIIALIIVGNSLQRIHIHMVIKKISREGINYDAFREMKVPKAWTSIDSLTLTMLIKDYDLRNSKLLNKRASSNLLKYLSSNSSFKELKEYYNSILMDIKCFPVSAKSNGKSMVSFVDSWSSYRSYGGSRRHEGTDLMPEENIRGFYPVLSMTDGIIEKLGWLEQGGYRIGIRGSSGAYYYYAHMDSYAPGMEIGDVIKAGQFLGYMGDSGYGKEGTRGMFDVHLHVGIYVQTTFGELSVDPYWILRNLENQ